MNTPEPNYPEQICHDCGAAHGKRPMSEACTSWNGKCDICGKMEGVTDPRDYGQLKDTWLSAAKAAGTACVLVLLAMFLASCAPFAINRHTSAPITAPVVSGLDQMQTNIAGASDDLSEIDSKIISLRQLK